MRFPEPLASTSPARMTNHTAATQRLLVGVRPEPYGSRCQLRHWEPRETPNWFQKGPKQIRQLAKRVRGGFSWNGVQICPAHTHTHTQESSRAAVT
ncbi:hypothetical protein EYF80_063057 [Liparis tanakae]|uniref:Uncharacterized protein n=1 Tax=Liparis tanakae TaxID=230148 RepID=A0A4Z2EE81_9TELE|nr:hypothetical protein EYF80_063057 [Liparis tanakae]